MKTAVNPYSEELELLAGNFGGQNRVAKILDVDRSCLTRWVKQRQIPDPRNQEKIVALHHIWVKLMTIFKPATAMKWLLGINAHLSNHRPLELIQQGRIAEVLAALEQCDTVAYA